MKKRIISIILTAVTVFSAVSAMNSNAIIQWGNKDNPAFLEKTFNGNELNEKYYPLYDFWLKENSNCYISPEGNHLVVVNPLENVISCKSTLYPDPKAENNKELWVKFNAYIDKINIEIEEKFGKDIFISIFNDELHLYNRNGYNIKEIIVFLQSYDTLYDMKYQTDRVSFTDVYSNYVTAYANFSNTEEKTSVINYVQKNIPEAEFYLNDNSTPTDSIENAGKFTIMLKDNHSLTAHLDLALEIFESTGVCPDGISPLTYTSGCFSDIYLDNYLDGDSNCDKKQTIADAVAILQFLGNPDDYPLSELGAFNADSDNNGITADDAVRIQQKDAGIL